MRFQEAVTYIISFNPYEFKPCEGANGESILRMKPLLKVKLKSDTRTQTWIFRLPGLNTFQYIQILKNIITGSCIVQSTL